MFNSEVTGICMLLLRICKNSTKNLSEKYYRIWISHWENNNIFKTEWSVFKVKIVPVTATGNWSEL